jgi:hypothetical protein
LVSASRLASLANWSASVASTACFVDSIGEVGGERWLAVLAFIPAAGLLADLPRAVLGALVIAAVLPLFRFLPVVRLWRVSRPHFLVAAGTFASTVALSPQVERGVLIGIALAIAVHLWRELHVEVELWEEGSDLHVRPGGCCSRARTSAKCSGHGRGRRRSLRHRRGLRASGPGTLRACELTVV